LREGLNYADLDAAIDYIEKDADEEMTEKAKSGSNVRYTGWSSIFNQKEDTGELKYHFYEYDKEEIKNLLTSAEG
jgi:hypothetical protein